MRIAIVHPSLAVRGGAEYVVVWLAEELSLRGHGVTIITTDFDERLYGPISEKNFTVVKLDLGGYELHPFKYIQAGWRLSRLLAHFDLVNPHNSPAYVWCYIARLINHRVPPIVWYCEAPERWFYPEICNPHVLQLLQSRQRGLTGRPRWRRVASRIRAGVGNWNRKIARIADRFTVPRLDKVLTNSAFIAGQVHAIFGVHAVPCLLGLPVDRFPVDTTPGVSPEGPYILTVSRLFPEKNIDNVLVAIGILRKRGGLAFRRYIVVGDGPERNALERRAKEMGIADAVQFTGDLPEHDLARFYRNAALVVYLPLDETFGLVFLEAALYKKPVLAPNHGGPTEIVRHRVTGVQVDPLNPEAIADAISYCLQSPDLMTRLAEEGSRRLSDEFTFSHYVDRFEAAIQSL
jgi:glycosyltransferase involved in cell wall biosynthesis